MKRLTIQPVKAIVNRKRSIRTVPDSLFNP